MAAGNPIATRISSSLTYEILDGVMFSNEILSDKKRRTGDQNLRYKLEQWKKIDTFDILNNISEYVTLMQLMDSLVNVNHAVSVVGKCIFDLNYKKSLPLNIDPQTHAGE